jgi:hypothetical protein
MHQNATSRQYLMEAAGYRGDNPKINDGPAAFAYFSSIIKKTKTIAKGTAWLGKNTYWVVTKDWTVDENNPSQNHCYLMMRGIVKRSYYYDVSTNEESINGFKLADSAEGLEIFLETTNQGENWLPNTQTLKSLKAGTSGENAALVGGLENFKKMVKGLPDKTTLNANLMRKYTSDPNFVLQVPEDQKDLYPTRPTTQTPQKP